MESLFVFSSVGTYANIRSLNNGCPHLLQGIEHTHAAIANLVLAALHKDLSAASPPVVAAHADSAASSAMLETWSALLTGGALALMPPGTGLGQLLGSAGVTAALLTGEQLESLLEVPASSLYIVPPYCIDHAGSRCAWRVPSKWHLECSRHPFTSAMPFVCLYVRRWRWVPLSCRMAALRRRQRCRRCCCARRKLRTTRCLKQSLRWPDTSESV